jgi:hypothetical protein
MVNSSMSLSKKRSENKPWTITHLQNYDRSGRIKYRSYQRGKVWNKPYKQKLIDSIYIGIDLPKIYVEVDSSGVHEQYYINDGKQRISTILEFINNEFPAHKSTPGIGGKYFRNLTDDENVDFMSKSFSVVCLYDWPTEDLIELFLRHQNSVKLNSMEKRKCMSELMTKLLSDLTTLPIFNPNMVAFKNKRGDYEEALSKLLYVGIKGSFEYKGFRANDIDKMFKDVQLETKEIKNNEAVRKIRTALNFLYEAFESAQVAPRLEKWEMFNIPLMVIKWLNEETLHNNKAEFGQAYCDFKQFITKQLELPNHEKSNEILSFEIALRTENVDNWKFRENFIKTYLKSRITGLLSKDPKRAFSEAQRIEIYNRDKGVCHKCGDTIPYNEFDADHHPITWHNGGPTTVENGKCCCQNCNRSTKVASTNNQTTLITEETEMEAV